MRSWARRYHSSSFTIALILYNTSQAQQAVPIQRLRSHSTQRSSYRQDEIGLVLLFLSITSSIRRPWDTSIVWPASSSPTVTIVRLSSEYSTSVSRAACGCITSIWRHEAPVRGVAQDALIQSECSLWDSCTDILYVVAEKRVGENFLGHAH